MINTLLTVLNTIVLIVAIVLIVSAFRNTRKTRELNRRSAAAVEEAEANNREAAAISRRSRELLAQADAAWGNTPGWVGDDCDQEDGPTSTRQVDPWAEIHHPDKHQPAAIQPAGLPVSLYQCQCGRQHQRPAPAPSITPPTGDNVVRASN